MAGFFDLGQALVGGDIDREGARLEGLDMGSRIKARSAQTERALAAAAIDRDISIARQRIAEQNQDDAATAKLVDLALAGLNPEQVTGAQLDQQELGFRADLANTALPIEQRQGAGLGRRGMPVTASDMLGPGGELSIDVFNPAAPIQTTATGTAQIGRDQAAATEDLANAALLEEKRTNPAAFRSNTTFNLGGGTLGDDVLSNVGPSTIMYDIKPEEATGISGAAKSMANTAFDVFNVNLPFPDADTAGNALNDLMVRTQVVGQQAVPGRPSNYLMQQLAAFGVSPNNPFRGDQRSLNRMEQTERYLAGEIDSLRRDLNGGLLTKADMSKGSRALRNLEALRRDYELVISRFNADVPAAPAAATSGTLPSGATWEVEETEQ